MAGKQCMERPEKGAIFSTVYVNLDKWSMTDLTVTVNTYMYSTSTNHWEIQLASKESYMDCSDNFVWWVEQLACKCLKYRKF